MILYLDTSAFLKLYLAEPESDRVRAAVADAEACCTHLIAYAELRAGLAMAERVGRLRAEERNASLRQLDSDWGRLRIVTPDAELIWRAGDLAERFALRGFDSVHLASAERVFGALGHPVDFRFVVYDKDLINAAHHLGVVLFP